MEELSPVQMALWRLWPMKPERQIMNGRSFGYALRKPSREARAIPVPYWLWKAECGLRPRSKRIAS